MKVNTTQNEVPCDPIWNQRDVVTDAEESSVRGSATAEDVS